MTTTTTEHLERAMPAPGRAGTGIALWLLALGGLFILVHQTFLYRMMLMATDGLRRVDPDWGHILVIPLLSAYFVYLRREQILGSPLQVRWLALPVLLLAMGGYALGLYPVRNDMVQGFFMVLGLLAMAWFLTGDRVMQWLWFPIVYLGFMIKVSDRLWDFIAFRMQLIAADLSVWALRFFAAFFNFYPTNRGSTIDLSFVREGVVVTESLNVAEACAGLRALMAFIALGVAVAFVVDRAWWKRLIMLAMTIPIAIAVNVGRVTTLGLLYLVDPSYSQGDFHLFIGMLMLIPGLLAFLALGWMLDQIFVPESAADSDAVRPVGVAEVKPAGGGPTARVLWGASVKDLWQQGPVLRGLAGGVLLAVLTMVAYIGYLASYQPEMVSDRLGGWFYWLVALACVVGLAGMILVLARMAPSALTARYSFLLALLAGVLLSGWIGQSTVIGMTRVVLIKQPIALRHSLHEVPRQLDSWVMVHEYPPLNADMEAELGTTEYFTRQYLDQDWPQQEPGAYAEVHIAYYTGIMDTVPHVPDRCFIAGGVTPRGIDVFPVMLGGEGYRPDPAHHGYRVDTRIEPGVFLPSRELDATLFTYSTPAADAISGPQLHNVAYFFVANGGFYARPEYVRLRGFSLRDRYIYYAKVEIRWPGLSDAQVAQQRSEALLSVLLPEVMACLPDWTALP